MKYHFILTDNKNRIIFDDSFETAKERLKTMVCTFNTFGRMYKYYTYELCVTPYDVLEKYGK